MIRKIVGFCVYGLIVLFIFYLINIALGVIIRKLGHTVEYGCVYHIPETDVYMEVCYEDTCALIYLELDHVPDPSTCQNVLQLNKRSGVRSEVKVGYDIQLFITESNLCYIAFQQDWTRKFVSAVNVDSGKCDISTKEFTIVFNHLNLYEESSIRDSCKVAVYLSNDLQMANVTYCGSLYGEYLSPIKEQKITRFKSLCRKDCI
jgi:hypothetical protein